MKPTPMNPIASPASQRGITTLAVTLLLLAIVTVIAIFATNTAFYELRTTTNENRARLAEQAAEYGVNLGGEYVKSQLENVVSPGVDGWMIPGSSRWTACPATPTAPHPCLAEVDPGRRPKMYFTTLADDTDGSTANDVADMVAAGGLTALTVSDDNTLPVKLKIQALLCRIDVTDPDNPDCALNPNAGNNIAVTLIATGAMDGENATATVKETWASYGTFTPASTVPLVASGAVVGLGNAQIVASPNAGGPGLAASIWSPNDVDIEAGGGGTGSVSTCHMGGFLGHGQVIVDDMLTACVGQNSPCGCPGGDDPDFLSGHGGGQVKQESLDVLDRDGGAGESDLPDITYFPGANSAGTAFDKNTDPSDDNLFEYIFNVAYVAEHASCNEDNLANCSEDRDTGVTDSDCGPGNDENCAIYAMEEDLGFQFVTCAELNALGAAAEGKYYVEDSPTANCSIGGQLGSPEGSIVLVVDKYLKFTGGTIYGMLFVRSDNNNALFEGAGNGQIFGSSVVMGSVDMKGTMDVIFYDWGAVPAGGKPPAAKFFGKVGGSWLDDDDGF